MYCSSRTQFLLVILKIPFHYVNKIYKQALFFPYYKFYLFICLKEEIQKKTGYVVMRAEGIYDVDANTSIDQLSEDLNIKMPEVFLIFSCFLIFQTVLSEIMAH